MFEDDWEHDCNTEKCVFCRTTPRIRYMLDMSNSIGNVFYRKIFGDYVEIDEIWYILDPIDDDR